MRYFSMTKTKLQTLDIAYCATFTSLIAACSWIAVPTAVPFTMQTFGIFLTMLMLGGKRGCYAVATYLLLGAVGAPVFSNFTGGLGKLVGTTGGYLLGFLCIAFLYFLAVKKPLEKPFYDAIVLTVGLFLCYLLGTIQFVFIYGRNVGEITMMSALTMCVIPYIIPDLLKLTLALSMAKRLRPFLKLQNTGI